MITDLLIMTCVIVWIIDLTDIIETIKKQIWKYVWNGKKEYKVYTLKPIDCSLCMTWWTGLIYLIIVGKFNLMMIGLVGLLSFLTPVIRDGLNLIKDILINSINLIYKILHLE